MILWKFSAKPNKNKAGLKAGIIEHRWVLSCEPYSLELYSQLRRDGEDWDDYHGDYFCVNVTKFWHLGSSHAYYDGPNCALSLGFIQFNWRLFGQCKKCSSTVR